MRRKRKGKSHSGSRFFKKIRLIRKAIYFTVIVVIWLLIFLVISFFYYYQGLPTLDKLEKESSRQIVRINDNNDQLLANRGGMYTSLISYHELPPYLIKAIIATEDRRFFNHFGIDPIAIIRAYFVNQKAGHIVQGGSTLTQQLAKMLFLTPEKTFKRKIQEALLAVQLERKFTKQQILSFYLNRAYFGSGNYGISNAAKSFFNKDVSQLNLKESALMAGVLKAPSKLSPKNNRKLAEERANLVTMAMINEGMLDEKELENSTIQAGYYSSLGQNLYFVDYVYDNFKQLVDQPKQQSKLISIETTLDQEIQKIMERALEEFIADKEKELKNAQIAAILMRKDGEIVGVLGGRGYKSTQFNRAFYAKRQAGSLFKVFVYLAAFENGFSPTQIIEDKKVNFSDWSPDNYESRYFGKVTLEEAFANSLNSVAIQLFRSVGEEKIIKMANNFGIKNNINKSDASIALGTTTVTLPEIVSAYGAIANDGILHEPYAIRSIKDGAGNVLYQRDKINSQEPLVSKKTADNIKLAMKAAVDKGTGQNAGVDNRNIYGKTGTSQQFRDAWFVGFDDQYVLGIWIGNDDNSPTSKIRGGSLPSLLFAKIMSRL